MSSPISLSTILKAQNNIKPIVHKTPLYHSKSLSEMFDKTIYLKLECFQPINVFKIRGAYNKIIHLSDREKKNGIITSSSGNHGIAVSYIGNLLNLNTVICVPKHANPDKISIIKKFNAEVIEFGSTYDECYEHALSIMKNKNLAFVHPFNDPLVIAGQGVIGLEILDQLDDPDCVIVPIGGGGLISGIATAIKNIKPRVSIIGVQPDGAPSMYKSILENKIIKLNTINTIADGLCTKQPGTLTFELVKKYVDKLLLVTDDELKQAVLTLLKEEHILTEPSGIAALASLNQIKKINGNKIVLVISGSNISIELLKNLLVKFKV